MSFVMRLKGKTFNSQCVSKLLTASVHQAQVHLSRLERKCFAVSELLYALQWCEEVKHSSSAVASFRSLLADWGLSEGLHSIVPLRELLETLYSRCVCSHEARTNSMNP